MLLWRALVVVAEASAADNRCKLRPQLSKLLGDMASGLLSNDLTVAS